jgi:diguanylate cyclase (GGDEF)-like protein
VTSAIQPPEQAPHVLSPAASVHILVLDPAVSALLAEQALPAGAADLVFVGCATGCGAIYEMLHRDCAVVVMGATLPDMTPAVLLAELLKVRGHLGAILTPPEAVLSPAEKDTPGLSLRAMAQPVTLSALIEAVRTVLRQAPAHPSTAPSIRSNRALLHCVNRFAAMASVTSRTTEALVDIGVELAQTLNVETVAILLLRTAAAPYLVVSGRRPMDAPYLARVTRMLDDAYHRLTGVRPPAANPNVHQPDAHALPPAEFGQALTLPLLLDHQIRGIIGVVSAATPSLPSELGAMSFQLANHAVQTYHDFWLARNMATRDPLTKLYNKGMFLDSLKQTWLLCQRNARPVGLLLLDIDHFKSLNDRHGHLVGDEVLCETAKLLTGAIRASDLAARFGGDEFAVILPESDLANTRAIANRLVESFRKHRFLPDQANLTATLSIGATAEVPSPGSSYHDLLAAADSALYLAKRSGRNRVCEPGVPDEISALTAPTLQPERPSEPRRGRVLLVDDEILVLQVLGHIAGSFGFDATLSSSLEDAVKALKEQPDGFDIVVTDLCLGAASGIELLTILSKSSPLTVKIVVSGYATKDVAIECLRHGAFDFIEKPFSATQVAASLERAMEHRRLVLENRRYHEHLEELVRQRNESLTDALGSLRRSYAQTIRTLAAILDVRESQTGLHSRLVGEAVRTLGRQMGVSAHKIETMEMGAILHDIGKIGIPDAILLKPGPLSDEEWRIMRSHCQIGYDLLGDVPFLQDATELALRHHERYDGKGYPGGLKGEEICLEARIFAAADAYHAMRSDRPYHPAMSPAEALQELARNAGTQFDPAVVAAFQTCQPEIEGVFAAGLIQNSGATL